MFPRFVIPAKVGIQHFVKYRHRDYRLRGNDGFQVFLLIAGTEQCSVPAQTVTNTMI